MKFDFLSLKNSVEKIRERYHTLRGDLRAIETEIRTVRDARINRADIIAMVDEWIRRSAAGFNEAVAGRMQRLFGTSSAPRVCDVGFFGLRAADFDNPGVKAMDSMMCTVFGPQIRNVVVAAIENMEWPDEGLRMSERTKKLEELASRERAMRQELETLVKDADAAGIELV